MVERWAVQISHSRTGRPDAGVQQLEEEKEQHVLLRPKKVVKEKLQFTRKAKWWTSVQKRVLANCFLPDFCSLTNWVCSLTPCSSQCERWGSRIWSSCDGRGPWRAPWRIPSMEKSSEDGGLEQLVSNSSQIVPRRGWLTGPHLGVGPAQLGTCTSCWLASTQSSQCLNKEKLQEMSKVKKMRPSQSKTNKQKQINKKHP